MAAKQLSVVHPVQQIVLRQWHRYLMKIWNREWFDDNSPCLYK